MTERPQATSGNASLAAVHGGRWQVAMDRAHDLVEPRFSQWASGWSWSSYHLARDLVAVSVFVLAHHQHRDPTAITQADVAALLGEVGRTHWTRAQSQDYSSIAVGERRRHPARIYRAEYREHQRGIALWHTARDAQTETLRRRLAADLAAAGVDLDDHDDPLTRTWLWLNHTPAPPTGDRIEVPELGPEVRQKYLREAAEYALTLFGLELPELGGGTSVSDLQRDGWWRGRVQVDDLGRVHVAEEPSQPGEPALPGAGRAVTVVTADGNTSSTSSSVDEVIAPMVDAVVDAPTAASRRKYQDPTAAIAESAAVLRAALRQAPTARTALREYSPGLWDVIWRHGSHHHIHLEIEPRVPFAAEVIVAALVGWHDWQTHRSDTDTTSDWGTATLLVRVPELDEWMPISVTPLPPS